MVSTEQLGTLYQQYGFWYFHITVNKKFVLIISDSKWGYNNNK